MLHYGSYKMISTLYGALLFLLIRYLTRKNVGVEKKILCCLPLFLMLTGVLQLPLSVLGNGFADNAVAKFTTVVVFPTPPF